jgi:dihydroorotate dehydrogenase (NAD+) catalytic subunit
MVYEVFKTVKVPVIGMGGIMHADDAIEFLLAGATAVAVGTANFVNPRATIDILDGIMTYMKDEKVEDINLLRGAAHAI